MTKKWRDVKVFISSTFRGMHAEQDQLVKVVFPELRARLEPHQSLLIELNRHLRANVTALNLQTIVKRPISFTVPESNHER